MVSVVRVLGLCWSLVYGYGFSEWECVGVGSWSVGFEY